ncbi:efflux RND transporter periplasmic adaptor subunit [Cupriavidus sp. DB3]|uniref:efflux RND transporter periplasmic adaptor subunit n=1 Tax=Cupriavidus sp. DB3 TaxID=2873259 RepID=UPI001CF56EA7|nr:efflux RND transporter periplasmic adaptor subunit [Cupriavidus sp. DB3]MCA7082559.1 efflux RND transporter periplasmic adaptor subunit [Cupriavidus sp. DB3]
MKHFPKRGWRALTMAAAVIVTAACGNAEQPAAPAAPSVEVLTLQPRPMAVSSELPGRIEPVRVAEVRARVAGIVLKRNFKEGSDVKAGDALFQIDPAPLQAALSRAEGELARAEAVLADADAVVRRYAPLVEIEAVSRQDFDAAQATLKSAQAARRSAAAEVKTARLNLEYATVRAPISGRIGRALVTEGALVGQGEATPMATIQQLDPVYVDFKQPVADVLRMREALEQGRLQQAPEGGVPIVATIEGTDKKREGRLLFSDISVDRGTGQVSLRGQLPNADSLLLPGMYVRVHVTHAIDPAAMLVPQRAVRRNPDGKAQLLVVGKGDVAETRQVRTGPMQGAEWQILEGVKPGERIVVGGDASPGQKVTIAPAAPARQATGQAGQGGQAGHEREAAPSNSPPAERG